MICFFSVGFQLSYYLKIHLLEFFVSMNAGKVNFDVIIIRIHPFIHLFLIESFVLHQYAILIIRIIHLLILRLDYDLLEIFSCSAGLVNLE